MGPASSDSNRCRRAGTNSARRRTGSGPKPARCRWRRAKIAALRVALHVSAVSESVVVSAAQVELPLARAADSVTVLAASDLRATQVETVADAMRSVPGVTVSRNGGRGSVTSLFPRGRRVGFHARPR